LFLFEKAGGCAVVVEAILFGRLDQLAWIYRKSKAATTAKSNSRSLRDDKQKNRQMRGPFAAFQDDDVLRMREG
jgi:hypothetical protein